MAAGGSKLAVVSALVGNTFVMIAKFVAFFFTGSGAILSEAIHTVADLLNQVLLFIGIVRSAKPADESFEFGYGAERHVWALISAVGIFFLGCGVTGYHGIHGLLDPSEFKDLGWAIGVLVVSFAIELFILIVAVRAVTKGRDRSVPLLKYLRREADPAGVAVILEDTAACVGVLIALAAIALTQITGQNYWDAIGSLLVSVLLGAVAIWLIWRNRDLLVGPSVPPHIRTQIQKILAANPAVEEIVDLRTRVLDSETYRVRANVRFDGSTLAERLEAHVEADFERLGSEEDFRAFRARFADQIVDLLAEEIDAIEKRIRSAVPKASRLDIEAD